MVLFYNISFVLVHKQNKTKNQLTANIPGFDKPMLTEVTSANC